MNNFLLELMTEEIPSRMQASAISEFEKLMMEELEKFRIAYDSIRSYISPRRMVFSARLSAKIEEFIEEKKGPQIASSPEIIKKFLQVHNAAIGDCCEKELDKKIFLFVKIKRPARNTAEILGDVIKNAMGKISWKKSMRWGRNKFYFARPLRNIMAIFGDQPLDISFDEIGLRSCDHTYGHRSLAPQRIEARNVDEYLEKMRNSFVIVDSNERERIIREKFKELESKLSVFIEVDEKLLEEVIGLVEYPVVLLGKIPEKFMKLPDETIITPMRVCQRYFPVRNGEKLAPYFVFVANNAAADEGKTIIAGNEKVLAARLADALFFFETDLQKPLESRLEDLKKITFNEELGTIFDRVNRVANVCDYLCESLGIEDTQFLKRAAILAKCDLSTNMVCEFPELQGIMGARYARIQKESPDVCAAIRDQYRPATEISNRVSALFSMADKIELIATFFAIGKEPTGSKDPFALRRAAIGILKIIEKFQFDLDLKRIVERAILQLSNNCLKSDTVERVYSFILDRLKAVLKESGVQQNILNAVASHEDRILYIFLKSRILNDIVRDDLGEKLLSAHKRMKNLVLSNNCTFIDEKLFQEREEVILWEKINELEKALLEIKNNGGNFDERFRKQLSACMKIEQTLADFLDNVLVNVDDEQIRQNRLSLLTKLFFIFNGIIPAGLN
ncbi:MAG: glycine--tRNA ligase subunit beta [Holosporaceae bacterium]|jgi:glycyl-tRNA synthetase beta chain|nr:glycine--tRNA ligase subunit beta [Holosporaceae bacterium]